jgi:hypothetical protein
VSATAGQADGVRSLADRFGFEPNMVVMEMGYDDDVDEDLRDGLTERVGELVDEDTDEVVDAVLLWYRDGDGDLFELLTDALGPLADNGVVWLLTPKAGRDGHVEPSEISESAPTAGLQQTSTVNAGKDWTGARLVSPRGAKKKKLAVVLCAGRRPWAPVRLGCASCRSTWEHRPPISRSKTRTIRMYACATFTAARQCCWSSIPSHSPARAKAN